MTRFEARTAYNVPIPRAFRDKAHALQWAEENRFVFPGIRVVQITATAVRTIWRHQPEAAASVAA